MPKRALFAIACAPALVGAAALADPVAGPIEVFAITQHPVAMPGELIDFTIAVENISTDSTAKVFVDIDLQYADGRQVQPFFFNSENPLTLGPGDAMISFIFVHVPPDAPPGPGLFSISARVGRVTGGSNHSDYTNPLYAVDSVPFLIEATPSRLYEQQITDAVVFGSR